MADRRRRRRREKLDTRREEEFKFRGMTLEELQELSLEELAPHLPSRARRKLKRGLSQAHRDFIEKVESGEGPFRTHLRDQVVLPSFVEKEIHIHTGQEFLRIDVKPEMIGHLLGEFAMTRQSVEHTGPGVGATRSSKYMPLK